MDKLYCCLVFVTFCLPVRVSAVQAAEMYDASPRPATGMMVVRYHHVINDNVYNNLSEHINAVLNLALSKSGREYRIETIRRPPVPVPRNIKFVQDGRYDVAWMHTSEKREEVLHAIRFPLYRGLCGWRLFFVRDGDVRFSALTSKSMLQSLAAGQGEYWPDVKILRSNQFTVKVAYARDNLFDMLNSERIDYFPRGIFEIGYERPEAEMHGLTIDMHAALVYPTAFYLFVRKNDTALIDALNNGFLQSVEDGSYQALFYSYFGDAIKEARLESRRILRLANPLLPDTTPLASDALWFQPGESYGDAIP